MEKAEQLVTTCMVDCSDNCPQEIITLMQESCKKSSKLDLASGTCVECTEKTIGQTCRGCFEKCAFEKFQQVKEELVRNAPKKQLDKHAEGVSRNVPLKNFS